MKTEKRNFEKEIEEILKEWMRELLKKRFTRPDDAGDYISREANELIGDICN